MNAAVEWVNGLAGHWARGMWPVLWQTAALAVAVGLVVLCNRRMSPALRFWLWMLVPMRLLVMPLIVVSLPVLANPPAAQSEPAAAPPSFISQAPVEAQALDLTAPPTPPAEPPSIPVPRQVRASIWTWLMAGWIAGVGFFALRLARGWLRMKTIAGQARENSDARVRDGAHEAAVMLGLRKMPRIMTAAEGVSPFVLGFFRPVVVLPAELADHVSSDELRSVLAHEFAHVRRRDALVGWVLACSDVIYFFNPVVHLVKRAIIFERERACDEEVLALAQAPRAVYARALLSATALTRPAAARVSCAPVLLESGQHLERRLKSIADERRPCAALSRTARLVLIAVAVLALPGVTCVQRKATSPATTTLVEPTSSSLIAPAVIAAKDINAKVAQLNLETATRDDVITLFGEPASYIWGKETFAKDKVPDPYIMFYSRAFSVMMLSGHVNEVRFEDRSDYSFRGALRVGSTLDEAVKVIGPPDRTVEGGTIAFEDGVLYKNAEINNEEVKSEKGVSYYARRAQGIRIFAFKEVVSAIYLMRKSPPPFATGTGQPREDRIDYPFVDDPALPGAWLGISFVSSIDQFQPDIKHSPPPIKGLVFMRDGGITTWFDLDFNAEGPAEGAMHWTKGLIIHPGNKTAAHYEIKSIAGKDYLFCEWKTGDYMFRGQKPWYYALSRCSPEDRIVDRIDYPFVDDPALRGTWEAVDYVATIEGFNPDQRQWSGEHALYPSKLTFDEGGKTSAVWTWTKGMIIHPGNQTAAQYVIKSLAGKTFLFVEWKNDDYVYRKMKPKYFVFTPGGTDDRLVDRTDYPFVDDPAVRGKWVSVDFVRTMDQFHPGRRSFPDRLFLKELTFLDGGKMPQAWMTWTQGLVIHHGDKTASAYTVKTLDGKDYLFFEWKSGDYTIRKMKPFYYVLTRAVEDQTNNIAAPPAAPTKPAPQELSLRQYDVTDLVSSMGGTKLLEMITGRTGLENWDSVGVLANDGRTTWSKLDSGDPDAMTPRMLYLRQNWLMVNQLEAMHHKLEILLAELRAGTPGAPANPAVGDQTNNIANPPGAPTMEAKELLMVEPSWAKRVTFTAANGTLILEFTGVDTRQSARIEVQPGRVLLVESQGSPRIVTDKLTLGRMVMADGKVQWPVNGTTNMSVTAHEGKVRMESGSQVRPIEADKITMSLPSLKPVSDEVSPVPAAPVSSAPSAIRVTPGMLGAVVQEVTPDMAKLLGLSEAKGALVAVLYQDFPAAKAGVKVGDVIVRYDGREVENATRLRDMVADTAPDTEVKLGIIRNGKEETLTARVGKLVQVLNFGPTTKDM